MKESGGKADRRLLRQVAGQFRPYRTQVLVVALLILVTSGLGVVSPLLIKVVFDRALFAPGGPNVRLLVKLVALMIAVPVVASAVGVYQSYLTNSVGQRVMRDLRARLYDHLQSLSLRFFTATRTGEIQSRLANDVGGLQTVITDTASTILSNGVILLSTLVAMLLLSWQLTVLSLLMLPLFTWLTRVVGRRRRQVSAETQTALADMSALTEETLSVSGVLLAKVFGRQAAQSARYEQQNERLAALQVRQQMIGRTFFAVVSTFFSITPALVYLVAGFTHGITPGTLVAFTTLQSRLFLPIGQLLQVVTEVSSSLALFERVFGYLDLEPDIVDADGARALARPVRGEVELDDVWFSYETAAGGAADGGSGGLTSEAGARVAGAHAEPSGSPPVNRGSGGLTSEASTHATGGRAKPSGSPPVNRGSGGLTSEAGAQETGGPAKPSGSPSVNGGRRWALRGVQLRAEPGMLVALVGPSGAGKTTISYLVPRLYDATRGAVRLDGVDVRGITLGSLADAIGMVTQESYLLHATVRENLAYARPDASDEEIQAAARAAQIHERILEFEDGYDTVVGERGYRLSGGEKQRLAIARVILKDPRVLILDEATSALDTANERLVQAALAPLMRGRTTIAIAHRLSTIRAADVIFALDRGQVVESGSHDELLLRDGVYARLYAEQYGGGAVEARCHDGIVLSDGHVVPVGGS
jgi:ATP-binding cassette subfamily B protein